ncbi:MAG: aromatic amino acid aminotransferase, partial [Hyphomicrobiales bacterium]|nr:aromatic amino acid aminotransferase [Hyphomicrobiales bacterium]
MYDSLPTHPEDKILRIMQLYRDDPRTAKIDLGVGVYKNAAGLTPIMGSVKAAE